MDANASRDSDAGALRAEFSRWTDAQMIDFIAARDGDDASAMEAARDGREGLIRACVASESRDVDESKDVTATPDDDDIDPLDAFMAGLAPVEGARAPTRADEDDDDGFERMFARGRAAPEARRRSDDVDDDDIIASAREYGDDDEHGIHRRRAPSELPSSSAASTSYEPFERVAYAPPKELRDAAPEDVARRREELDIRVEGCERIAPIERFGQGGFDVDTLKALKRCGFEKPTPIQAQGVPTALAGFDVLAMAKTGSGKTLTFILPALSHIARQRALSKNEGPIALILAPTRELTGQISNEVNKICKHLRPRCCAIYGGVSKTEQFKSLRGGAEIVVATPGRLIDVLTMKNSTNLNRVTYLALDEADRMLDMGFEKAVRSICRAIRPDRQCVLFSATMPPSMKRLCRDVLGDAFATITVGHVGAANADVRQVARVFADDAARAQWLFSTLPELIDAGQVLVFVTHKSSADELVHDLSTRGIRSVGLHGDLDQQERYAAMKAFKSESVHVLVATDVAARGLDVESIKTVINYHPARDIATHVHRIGRTGRAGALDGCAYTLLTARDSMRFAQQLAANFEAAAQPVPDDLKALARGSYKRSREEYQGEDRHHATFGGRGRGRGRGGLGFSSDERQRSTFASPHAGRGPPPPRREPNEDYSAVPPPLMPPPPPSLHPPTRADVEDIVARARAKAQAVAATFQQPQQPAATTAAVAAAQAIAQRLLAQNNEASKDST